MGKQSRQSVSVCLGCAGSRGPVVTPQKKPEKSDCQVSGVVHNRGTMTTCHQIHAADCIYAETVSDLSTRDLRRINAECEEVIANPQNDREYEMYNHVLSRVEQELKRRGLA